MTLTKVNPVEFGQLIFTIEKKAFTRDFDLCSRDVQEEVDYLKDGEVYIAYSDEVAMGYIAYKPSTQNSAEIIALAVLPDHQGKGVGRKMIAEVIDLLKGSRIHLVTHPKNSSAIILYLKSGFVITGLKQDYYGDGQPRLILERMA